MKKLIIAFCLFHSICFANNYKLITEHYVVNSNDTLDSITYQFMSKNTYSEREFYEFRSGIIELNTFLLERNVEPGDHLTINYWINNE